MPMKIRPELLALLSALFLAAPAASAEDVKAPAVAPGLPTAKTTDATFSVEDDAVIVTFTSTKSTVRLHPVAAAVFALSDGKRSVEAIRKEAEELTGYPLDEDTVFGVLDALADAKLLAARVSPPGSESDLDLVLLSDGTAGNELVTASPGKGALEWGKARAQEEAAKVKLRAKRRAESEAKANKLELKKAEMERKKAHKELLLDRKKHESAVKAGKAKGVDEKLVAKKKSLEQSIKAEGKLRKDEGAVEANAKAKATTTTIKTK